MKRFVAIIISLLLAGPSPAWAQARTFKPKLAGAFGSVEFNALYEENNNESSSYSSKSTDTTFKEVLKVGTKGYVYHPNFVSFLLKASEALEEEKIETGGRGGDWSTFTSEAYEARAYVLPTHPYNLEAFSVLSRPLIAGNLAGSGKRERQRHGTYFRYRKQPVAGSLNWTYDRFKGTYTAKNNAYWADTSFSKFTYLHGMARYADSKTSNNEQGENTQFTLSNQHAIEMFNLSSTWQQNADKNTGGDDGADSDNLRQRMWIETLSIDLPRWKINSALSYSIDRAKSDRLELPALTEEKNFVNNENMNASLVHTLYRSIYTNLNLSQTISDSSSGKNTITNAKGSVDYRKLIYRGSFSAGVWKAYNNLDRLGALTLLQDQAYNTGVAGNPFSLADRFVDENTIEIKIVDPNGALEETTLVKDLHYTVDTSVDTTRITIGPILPGLYNIANINDYTLLIAYSFINTTFELETNSSGFSTNLNALDSLLSPYYSYTRTTQELIDGAITGGTNNSEAHVVGFRTTKTPFYFGVEYSRIFARRNPEKRWYEFGEYRKDITENTKLQAKLESERTTYYLGDDELPTENEPPERIYKATLNGYTAWPKKFLNMNIGTFYSRRLWEVTSDVYSVYTNLNWRLGRVDVNLGAQYSDTSSTTRSGSTTSSDTMVIYLNLKRKLF